MFLGNNANAPVNPNEKSKDWSWDFKEKKNGFDDNKLSFIEGNPFELLQLNRSKTVGLDDEGGEGAE